MDIHIQSELLYICFGINKYGTDVIRIQIRDPCFSLKIAILPLNSNTRRTIYILYTTYLPYTEGTIITLIAIRFM
jgi:hypothetical protein